MAIDEQKLDESVAETEKRLDEQRKLSTFKAIEPKTFLWFGIVVVFIMWLVWSKRITNNQGIVITFVAMAILYLISQGQKNLSELDEQTFTNIIYKKLLYKQNYTGEIPEGEIVMGLAGKRWTRNGIPFKREKHFKVTKQNGIEEDWIAQGDPYTANIVGLIRKDEGYTGEGKLDQEYIYSPGLQGEMRYLESTKTLRRGR